MKNFLLIAGLIILFAAEILHVYLILPMPGSQQSNTIGFAYFLHKYIWPIRFVGLSMVLLGINNRFGTKQNYAYAMKGRFTKGQRITLAIIGVVYLGILYEANFVMQAEKMFVQPKHRSFLAADENTVPVNSLVIGIDINNEAKAYPIQLIGYHHQVQDTIGGEPVLITYCTVCRTGRAYSPIVNGRHEQFRLVGMDHFNAMLEDGTTKSWWRQATGEAIAGPYKGFHLNTIPVEQMQLASWISNHPFTTIMQPDTIYNKRYDKLKGFDKGDIDDDLERRDSGSWKLKSWVVGIEYKDEAKAYDWNLLAEKRIVQDSISGLPLLITVENDTASFHTLNRKVNQQVLKFTIDPKTGLLKDGQTKSSWTFSGICTAGLLKGTVLETVQSYQEFWHSWKTFHPRTTQYEHTD